MTWIEIEIERENQVIKASGRGSRGERVAPFDLSPVNLGRLTGLASAVRRSVSASQPLPEHAVTSAHELYEALFRDRLRDLLVSLGEAARAQGRKVLLRLMIRDPELQRFPWEVMCRPGTARDFIGCLAEIQVARGVNSHEPHEPREVRRSVRILAISPLGEQEKLASLKAALHEPIAEGALQWLDPIVGEQTIGARLFELLRRADAPHIIHWIGHGGADAQQNPCLYLAEDRDGEAQIILAESLAQELRTSLGAELRLVVLEACSGARPGAFASAAEILARSGADAVLAHLWPVKAEVARDLSADFYRNLTGTRDGMGDVAASLHATRRTFMERSAEVFSPVLYLRGADPRVLDFKRRRLVAATSAASGGVLDEIEPALLNVLKAPFSLVLGGGGAAIPGHAELVSGLVSELSRSGERDLGQLGLSALAQRFFLRHGKGKLNRIFQKTIGSAVELSVPPFVQALSEALPPGAHTTLLWLPLLEHALSARHKDRNIYVVQPAAPGSGESRLVMVRRAGAQAWEEDDDPPPDVDLQRDFMILRLYGGYSPEVQPVLANPQLTEDDHIQGLMELRELFPTDWEDQFVGWMRSHPLLCAGISVLEWRHRMLLRWLLDQRPPSRVSVAVIDPESGEKEIWDRGAGGLFGQGTVRAVALSLPQLAQVLAEVKP
jgi:hypothetical protein